MRARITNAESDLGTSDFGDHAFRAVHQKSAVTFRREWRAFHRSGGYACSVSALCVAAQAVRGAVGATHASVVSVGDAFDEHVAVACRFADVGAALFVGNCAGCNLIAFGVVMRDAMLASRATHFVDDAVAARDDLVIARATCFRSAGRTQRGGRATANDEPAFELVFRAICADFRAVDDSAFVDGICARDEMRAVACAENAGVRVAKCCGDRVAITVQALRNVFARLGFHQAARAFILATVEQQMIDASAGLTSVRWVVRFGAACDACAQTLDLRETCRW